MEAYPKIQTVWLRDPATKFKSLLREQWAKPEFGYLADREWEFTEKVDGTNVRIIWDGDMLSYGGRDNISQIPQFLLGRLEEIFEPQLDVFVSKFGSNQVCLYGEGYGNKIQHGGHLYIPGGTNFILFDVKVGGWWLERDSIADVAASFNIDTVPVIGSGTLLDMVELVENRLLSQFGDFVAEGIVARPGVQLFNRFGERVITKIKSKDFATGGKR